MVQPWVVHLHLADLAVGLEVREEVLEVEGVEEPLVVLVTEDRAVELF